MMTDETGNLVHQYVYTAFGNENYKHPIPSFTMSNRYTGQILDEDTGLYFYGARYYDPEIARFTQPDTIVPEAGSSQALNRYSYVKNNPLKYVDPSGHGYHLSMPSSSYGGYGGGWQTPAISGGFTSYFGSGLDSFMGSSSFLFSSSYSYSPALSFSLYSASSFRTFSTYSAGLDAGFSNSYYWNSFSVNRDMPSLTLNLAQALDTKWADRYDFEHVFENSFDLKPKPFDFRPWYKKVGVTVALPNVSYFSPFFLGGGAGHELVGLRGKGWRSYTYPQGGLGISGPSANVGAGFVFNITDHDQYGGLFHNISAITPPFGPYGSVGFDYSWSNTGVKAFHINWGYSRASASIQKQYYMYTKELPKEIRRGLSWIQDRWSPTGK